MLSIRDNYVNWNGKSSDDYGIIIKRNPTIIRADQKYEVYNVAGKNGDIYMMQDAWNNYVQSYELFIGDGSENSVPDAYAQVADWLKTSITTPTIDDYINLTINGYHKLQDSYETDCIKLATLVQGVQINNQRGIFGNGIVQFNCRPERFTLDAFTSVTKTASYDSIINPTGYDAKPFIKIYGSGSGTLTIRGRYIIRVSDIVDYIHIDCDSQNCFRQLSENRNDVVTLTGGFPVLHSGTSSIVRSGGITKVEITPRWWRL